MIARSPAAGSRFDEIVHESEQWFKDQPGVDLADARAFAAVMTSMTIGALGMQDHIARVIGENPPVAEAAGPGRPCVQRHLIPGIAPSATTTTRRA